MDGAEQRQPGLDFRGFFIRWNQTRRGGQRWSNLYLHRFGRHVDGARQQPDLDLRGRLIRRKQTRLRGSIRTDLHFHLATPWQRGESIVALSLDGLDIAAEFGFDDGQLVGQQRHFQRQNE